MTEKKRPVFRIVARHKETGELITAGAVWEPFPGKFNISPVTETKREVPYPEISLVEAITSGEFYLNMYPNTPKKNTDAGDEPTGAVDSSDF